jgi:hypothetical protein
MGKVKGKREKEQKKGKGKRQDTVDDLATIHDTDQLVSWCFVV